ncbi:MAG TPA: glycosyltransferase family 39 protein [Blastocatellia bacterium]|nr:glycosyltransferase family 39 protein [Blastocatellia bacterium]
MQTGTVVNVEPADSSERSSESRWVMRWAKRASRWLALTLAPPQSGPLSVKSRIPLAVVCAIIFLSALGVRLLHQQDGQNELFRRGTMMKGLIKPYWQQAERIIGEGSLLVPRETTDPGDARLLLHPPGYSIFLAAIHGFFGNLNTLLKPMQVIQMSCDALSALLVFFIAGELLPYGLAITAAMLAAISPHLAYYSLWLSPDSLAVLPILIAVYLLIRAIKRPRLVTVIAAGAMIGLSCWLRTNSLLLAPFLAVMILALFERGKRLRYSAALAGAMMLTISPIIIRNWVVYHRFVPLSLASGLNLIQGIAEYDVEGRFGMPLGDGDAKQKDIEWNNRPDYAEGLWRPDGIERDRARFARGMAVIRLNPRWFLGAMLRRAGFMLSYNDSRAHTWPFYSAVVPPVSTEPAFGHWTTSVEGLAPVWSGSGSEAMTSGAVATAQTEISLVPEGAALRITGDESEYGNQFISAPIAVKKDTDYTLRLALDLEQGHAAVKVTSPDRRVTLASAIMETANGAQRKSRKSSNAGNDQKNRITELPFASGNRTEVRLVLSNNGDGTLRPVELLRGQELFALGPTSQVWTHYPRVLVRFLQKNLFTTTRMLPLVIIGIILMALAKRGRALLILLAIPVYFVCSHAAFSTEYRYVLAIHYFLFVMAAVTLYCFWVGTSRSAQRIYAGIFGRDSLGSRVTGTGHHQA